MKSKFKPKSGEGRQFWFKNRKSPQNPVSSLIDYQHPWQMDLQLHTMDGAISSCPNQTISGQDMHIQH